MTTSVNAQKKYKKRRHQLRGRQVDPKVRADLERLFDDAPRDKTLLIEYLHRIQDRDHFISAAQIVALADWLKLSAVEVYEVASFYHHFDVVKDNEQPPPPITIRVCQSLSCELAGSARLIEQLEHALGASCRVQAVPCVGQCAHAPVAVLGQRIIEQASLSRVKTLFEHQQTEAVSPPDAIGFEQYKSLQGYRLLQSCLDANRDPESIIVSLEQSNLRGLGGAGFPVGRKWRLLREQPAPRYVAVNIDEGEPGTFKDGYFLQRDPHRFIEGMLIAAWAIEASAIYIYLRDEYAALRALLLNELERVRQHFSNQIPPIHLRRGAGAYICGEESAMIESIEGKRGMPRQRPPYLAEVGLFGRPTLEHNMESLYWLRDIIEKGADWFTRQGRHGRSGFRSFSVSGRVNRPGVHIAPAGITLKELIDEYCGGMLSGHQLYGYFPGGASGGMLPAHLDNIPLDFDTLQEHGCFIGSAAIIVFSQQDSARQLALNAMKFFAAESCGQCTPCRAGTAQAVQLMQQAQWDTALLKELSETMADASICGLGQAAPNPLLCALRYFAQEFE